MAIFARHRVYGAILRAVALSLFVLLAVYRSRLRGIRRFSVASGSGSAGCDGPYACARLLPHWRVRASLRFALGRFWLSVAAATVLALFVSLGSAAGRGCSVGLKSLQRTWPAWRASFGTRVGVSLLCRRSAHPRGGDLSRAPSNNVGQEYRDRPTTRRWVRYRSIACNRGNLRSNPSSCWSANRAGRARPWRARRGT